MVPPGVLYIKATKLSDAGSYRFVFVLVSYNYKTICEIKLVKKKLCNILSIFTDA